MKDTGKAIQALLYTFAFFSFYAALHGEPGAFLAGFNNVVVGTLIGYVEYLEELNGSKRFNV